MGLTQNLRTAIQTKLITYVVNTTYQKALTTHASGMWLVYDFDQVVDNENLSLYRLEVDLLNKNSSTTDIEDKADEIWNGLDHWTYLDTNVGFTVYRELKNNLLEEEKDLNHRRLTFNLKLYK